MALPFTEYSVAWQHLVCLLYAIENVQGEIPSKGATVAFLREKGLLKLRPEDRQPYETCTEPSWITDIAWSRKAGVIAGLVRFDEWNCWEISREGRTALQKLLPGSREQTLDVRRCFLWHPRFKKVFNTDYEESALDLIAPPKGKRRVDPDPEIWLPTINILIKDGAVTIFSLAQTLTEKLKFPVAANIISVATAFAFVQVNVMMESAHVPDPQSEG